MEIVAIIFDAIQLVILFTACHVHQYGRRVGGPSLPVRQPGVWKHDFASVGLVFKILIGRGITKGRERRPSALIRENIYRDGGAKQ
jgi:hypothetical protein